MSPQEFISVGLDFMKTIAKAKTSWVLRESFYPSDFKAQKEEEKWKAEEKKKAEIKKKILADWNEEVSLDQVS